MFKGKKTILRAYEKAFSTLACKYFNDEEFRSFLSPSALLPISQTEEDGIIDGFMNPKNESNSYTFAITTLQGKYLGGCSYFNFNHEAGTVWIGIAIGDKKYWGKGYGTDALNTLLLLLFNEHNTRKVLLNVFDFNERGIASYKKLGFKEEGRLKQQQYRKGKYHDDVIMALFKKDYLKK